MRDRCARTRVFIGAWSRDARSMRSWSGRWPKRCSRRYHLCITGYGRNLRLLRPYFGTGCCFSRSSGRQSDEWWWINVVRDDWEGWIHLGYPHELHETKNASLASVWGCACGTLVGVDDGYMCPQTVEGGECVVYSTRGGPKSPGSLFLKDQPSWLGALYPSSLVESDVWSRRGQIWCLTCDAPDGWLWQRPDLLWWWLVSLYKDAQEVYTGGLVCWNSLCSWGQCRRLSHDGPKHYGRGKWLVEYCSLQTK